MIRALNFFLSHIKALSPVPEAFSQILLNNARKSTEAEDRGKAHSLHLPSESVLFLQLAQSLATSKDREKRTEYTGASHTCGCTLLHRGQQAEKGTCRENSPF